MRTNYVKFHIDKFDNSALRRMCGDKGESFCHLISKCGKLAQREYKRRQNDIARYFHWQLCEKAGIETNEKWYEHKPECVMENNEDKI